MPEDLNFIDALAVEYADHMKTRRELGKYITNDELFIWLVGKFCRHLAEIKKQKKHD